MKHLNTAMVIRFTLFTWEISDTRTQLSSPIPTTTCSLQSLEGSVSSSINGRVRWNMKHAKHMENPRVSPKDRCCFYEL
ncbi:hypothetical protein ACLOJK_030382 [Asimina triloba]